MNILILGAGLMQKPAIMASKSMGYTTVVIDADEKVIKERAEKIRYDPMTGRIICLDSEEYNALSEDQKSRLVKRESLIIVWSNLLYNSFNVHPIKYPVIGTISDINKITKEDLYTCYNTFYNANNMILIISGNLISFELSLVT